MTNKSYAVVFPGQGSQSVGMLSGLAEAYPIIQDTFGVASEILGYDLWTLAQTGPEEKIKQTEFTQPLMYSSGVALWRLWESLTKGQKPVVMAGHSLGEFCALTASGTFSYEQCIQLVKLRAELMATAVEEGQGGMAAILGMDDDKVIEVCESINGARVVQAVNFNGPGQVAISGHLDAVEKAMELAREKGAKKVVMLPVSVPNHSSLMRDAGEKLSAQIDQMNATAPQCPVMQNTHATVAEDVDGLLASLKSHVFSPVQWTQSYRNIVDQYSPELVFELGPGKVLAGLGKRIDRSIKVYPFDTAENVDAAMEVLA